MKIYTRTGDAGETGLLGGGRVPKSHPRVEAYGAVDELNAMLGLAAAYLDGEEPAALLRELQQDCFLLGADLAAPPGPARRQETGLPQVTAQRVQALEAWIDRLDAELPPLRQFILPGGTVAASALHVARTVARRAERRVAALAAQEEVNPVILQYLNRLSDLLFVLARWVNHRAGVPDVPWQREP
ncbi:ATP:cob(I)alamin adenosyltransferase [Thermaerobacter marianensis DSM 12885]|uniref:Corrinoid adenosyltransferase n=1 Tax=Thermaerobacter marianensis (strain ATCC 700841 / DSM 12885 / JCM 10246 / 7p75a) TaxID=644966 RepID=E6SL45_THEM7|nr:cob(I)yrinic acid a,c-diamide adenosyltransferase [Thermaerobacter marianensis]ADU50247.1 ATP:cob(I)alamin adenosyltransferase [Thermaerobacter marianensis DSM 12885]